MKIKAIATTKKGSSSFSLLNPERFLEMLKEFSGNIEIQISSISDDATEKQKAYFRAEILNSFIKLAQEAGNLFSDSKAENFLISEAGLEKESIEDLSKKELSVLIDNSKILISEFFGANLK